MPAETSDIHNFKISTELYLQLQLPAASSITAQTHLGFCTMTTAPKYIIFICSDERG